MLIASKEMMSLPDATPPAPAHWLGFYVEAINANATVTMGKSGGDTAPAPSLLYSTDAGITWAPFDNNGGTTIALANVGDRVYFCADEANTAFGSPSTDNDYYRFRFSNGYVKIGGNILSLLSPTEVTDFPATTARDTFKRLFYGQSYLRDASALVFPPSTREASYKCMFESCSGLSAAPALPATTLEPNCYAYMFRYNGSALATAPDLPATTLAQSCYEGMFWDCRALRAAPHLPATTLAQSCYNSMFRSCTSLTSASVAFTSWGYTETQSWFSGVTGEGVFHCPEALGDNETIARGDSRCPYGWSVKANDKYWGMYFEAAQANSTVGMQRVGNPPSATVEFSTDNGATWSVVDFGNTTVTLASVGDRVFFRSGAAGNTSFSNSSPWSHYHKFVGTGQLKVAGNLMSLLTQTETADYPPTADSYTFCRLLNDCTALVDAAKLELPATVKGNCYRDMFNNCSALATAPALPATSMADNCYSGMFIGTASLTTPPDLPATTLAPYCYDWMFADGSGITAAPALPATTLADYCYEGMFKGCASLVTAPTLSAKTMVNGCYSQMFLNCSALNSIATKQTSFTGCYNWLSGVAATGTFECNTSALGDGSSISRGASACPYGWTVSEMPAFWGLYVEAARAGATVKMSTGGPSITLEYSTDGDVWDSYNTSSGTTITLANVGDKVYFRSGASGNTRTSTSDGYYRNFIFSDQVKVGGNILSLLRQSEIHAIPTSDAFTFASLFRDQAALIDASDLIMPSNITGHGFQYMFEGCSNMVAAPALPATTLADACYAYMYTYCSSLQSITTAQTEWYDNISACYGWVDGVASIGAFHCPAALGTGATIARGSSECPSGWTVINV